MDAHYKVIYADGGCQGRIYDDGAWKHTNFCIKREQKDICLLPAEPF
jgi:hypothetical protein